MLMLCMVESCEKWFEMVRVFPKREWETERESAWEWARWRKSSNEHKCPYTECVFDMEPICSFSPFFCSLFFPRFLSPTHFTKQRRWQRLNWRWMSEQSDDDFRAYRGRILRCYRCCCCTLQFVCKMVRRRIQERIHSDWDMYTNVSRVCMQRTHVVELLTVFNWKIGGNRNNEYDFIAHFLIFASEWRRKSERMVRVKIVKFE